MSPRHARSGWAVRIVTVALLVGCTGTTGSETPTVGAVSPDASSDIPRIPSMQPGAVAVDTDGTLYLSDCLEHRIYRVDTAGTVTTFGVGDGGLDNGFAGDGGPATKATFSCPSGLALDGNGNLYIDDHANNRIRLVDARGRVTTVAGSGAAGVNRGGYAGDGGLATNARLSEPVGIAFDTHGELFIADRDNYAVRMVDTHGVIATIAGTGTPGSPGDGALATKARLSDPECVAVDPQGRIYITDQFSQRVRMIDTHGVITTVAGTGEAGSAGDGGPATEAMLNDPFGLAIDASGNLYVSDSSGARVRMIDRHGVIATVAGTGEVGYAGDGGPATQAMLDQPYGLAVDVNGNLYIADAGNGAIRMVDMNGVITTVVGS